MPRRLWEGCPSLCAARCCFLKVAYRACSEIGNGGRKSNQYKRQNNMTSWPQIRGPEKWLSAAGVFDVPNLLGWQINHICTGKVFPDIKGFICLLICFRPQRPCYKIRGRKEKERGWREGLGTGQGFFPIGQAVLLTQEARPQTP